MLDQTKILRINQSIITLEITLTVHRIPGEGVTRSASYRILGEGGNWFFFSLCKYAVCSVKSIPVFNLSRNSQLI